MSSRHARTHARSPRAALAAALAATALLAPMSVTTTAAAAPAPQAGVSAPQAGVSERAGSAEKSRFPNIRTWKRLAGCESGRRWHINTGNGYYGGLQFSPSTWRGYGGGRFAAYADQATRNEQITTAQKVRRSQGWGAWPHCSRKLGLGRQ